jgi:flavin-binding protein dodecin
LQTGKNPPTPELGPTALSISGRDPEHGKGLRERRKPGMESTYKVIELVGTSPESWERAAAVALAEAKKTLRDLRIAEVEALDIHIDEHGEIIAYRTKLKVSFKYED